MQISKYLEKHQPIIYRTFVNSLKAKRLSHAYLVSGTPGTPLLEVAKTLAKSVLCDDPEPLACNNCITCLRIDSDNYPDFVILDGESGTVKKEDVDNLENQFEKTAFESKGVMIYILHLVENMSSQVVNGILKFLEEPGQEIYAFLTTNNENNILPTIISRCQVLRLKLVDRKEVIKEAIQDGVDPKDAELLSYFYNDSELIANMLENEDEKDLYEVAKSSLELTLENLKEQDIEKTIYFTELEIIPKVKDKECGRFFIDMLTQAFEDILNIQKGKECILSAYQETLSSLASQIKDIDRILMKVLKSRNLINTNVNISLLIDHLIMSIVKED